jgi:hypothetical protein
LNRWTTRGVLHERTDLLDGGTMSKARTALAALVLAAVSAVVAAAAGTSAVASGDSRGGRNIVREHLSSYQEAPQTLSTTGVGSFQVWIDDDEQQIRYRLSYSSLAGDVTAAHIHLGAVHQAGGIIVFICANAGTIPPDTQTCPAAPAVVTGTFTPTTVVGPAAQGIAAGEWAEFVAALRAGVTYVNVHSSAYPAGEIRAQLGDHHH